MGLSHSPSIVTNGLVLCLDAVNQKSNGNNLVNTHNLTAAQWGVENNVITATNEVVSPIGTPVFKMTATGAGRTYLVQGYQSFSKTSSWTSSVYVRGGTYNFVRLGPSIASSADGVVVNLTTGAVVRTPYSVGYPTFTVSDVGNGWFRISRTVQNDSYVLKCFALYMTSYLGNADVGDSQAGQFPANGEFIYVTAPQFEHTTSPRSYVQNNTTTRNWKDITGLNNEAVRVNGADFVSATNSNIAMSFDGTDDYVDCGNNSSLSSIGGTTNITVSAWVYHTAYGGGGQPYSVITVKGNPWTWLMENPSNTFTFRITAGGADVNIVDTSTHLLNTWYNVVGTYDGSNMRIYVNGVLKNTQAQTGTLATNAVTAKIGTFQGTNYNLTGRITNVSIYNRTLTAVEVQQNFNAYRGRYGI